MIKETYQILFTNREDRTNFLNFIKKEIETGNIAVDPDYDSQFLGETVNDIILIITSVWTILHPILKHYKKKNKKKKIQRIVNLTTGIVIEKEEEM